MILLIDNYDSFTYNLAQYLGQFDTVKVLRNDAVELELETKKADLLVFSPGPGWPADAGKMMTMIKQFAGKKAILGICLGHQAIAEVFGGELCLARQVMHGKQSQIKVCNPSIIFHELPEQLTVMRYHSLVVDTVPNDFEVIAKSLDDDEIMAIQHKCLPIYGLQFHPESIGSPEGMRMIQNIVESIDLKRRVK